MDPFATPPSGNPVSFEPPHRRSTGRAALVALVTLGLVGGSVAGISQFASADRPETTPSTVTETATVTDPAEPETTAPQTTVPETTVPTDETDPPVIDLDELGDIDADALDQFAACLGLPPLGLDVELDDLESIDDLDIDVILGDVFDLGEGGPLDGALGELLDDLLSEFGGESRPGTVFDDFEFDLDGGFDGQVTVTGPDGVEVIDLGENGSVTITKDGDDVAINTEGDATASDLSELFDDFGTVFGGDDLFESEKLDELLESFPGFDELPELESIDPDAMQTCVDDVLGR